MFAFFYILYIISNYLDLIFFLSFQCSQILVSSILLIDFEMQASF